MRRHRPVTGFTPGFTQGFTLIELLVALFIMALLAGLSWRGIDGMARSQTASRARADQVTTLSTSLAQWVTDLDHLQQMPNHSALDYDGRVLRITRSYGQSDLRVVGWSKRTVDGQVRWLRWQSATLNTRAELDTAWAQAQRWGQNPGEAERRSEISIADIDDWQIFYFRNNTWSNPLSSSGNATPAAPVAPAVPIAANTTALPDGIRLVLTLSAGQAVSGALTRDWVRPIVGGTL